ncbi:MAG: ABC transporter permease, partial [Pseudomonadota bacterium]
MSSDLYRAQGAGASLRRIGALLIRHLYLLRGSWPRVLELMYWPTVQMVLWGFITLFLVNHSSWLAQASGVLLTGVLLWDVLFRGQLGVSLVFMEEMWSRNLGHLFVSPLRTTELAAALLSMSLVRTLIGVGGAALVAIPLFHFSVFDMGLPLLA